MTVDPTMIRDLGNKLGEDLTSAFSRTVPLVYDRTAQLQVITVGFVTALPWLAACLERCGCRGAGPVDGTSPTESVWLTSFILARSATDHPNPIEQGRKDFEAFKAMGGINVR